jgi:hypothetical protein
VIFVLGMQNYQVFQWWMWTMHCCKKQLDQWSGDSSNWECGLMDLGLFFVVLQVDLAVERAPSVPKLLTAMVLYISVLETCFVQRSTQGLKMGMSCHAKTFQCISCSRLWWTRQMCHLCENYTSVEGLCWII